MPPPTSVCLTRAFHEPCSAKQKAQSSHHALRWKMKRAAEEEEGTALSQSSIWDPKPCTPLFSHSSFFILTPTPQESSEWL